ncbi:Tat pathway signal protein [Streptodolium elevatio]|uniref:Tat pathway signal protein n=1 Tax=Streptodolium elevatio TaxID=3157996 RepID=A0ABV3DA14_9ACTN
MGDHPRRANEQLAAAMASQNLGQAELAEELNRVMADFTGKLGTLSDRHVRRWLTGQSTWPHERQRRALETVFGCPAGELGFVPRAAPVPEVEPPVERRRFLASATAVTAGAALPLSAARYTLGMSDVQRLRSRLDGLVGDDNTHGGTTSLESRASGLAGATLDILDSGTASQRVRGHFYSLAASFASTAMWAALDGRRDADAVRHMERALSLAGYARDSAATWRVWSHGSMLALQRKRPADAFAASEASQACSVVRADPLFASLTHARIAGIRAAFGDPSGALRSLDWAADAFGRADLGWARPSWMGFYDQAELAGLACVALLAAGRPVEAEGQAHRALALLRPDLHRNRAYYTAYLARTQLAQGDLEQASDTARTVITDAGALSGRTRSLLLGFSASLSAAAPGSPEAREWAEELRETARSKE